MSGDNLHLQGLNVSTGQGPTKEERAAWIAGWVLREAVLIAPDKLDEREQTRYFNKLMAFVVRRSPFWLPGGLMLFDRNRKANGSWLKRKEPDRIVMFVCRTSLRLPSINTLNVSTKIAPWARAKCLVSL